jgi:hypothetical protein
LWFSYFLRFLISHPEIGWSFWALNGTDHDGHSHPNYILGDDWKSLRLTYAVDALRDVEVPSSPGAAG